MVLTDQSLADFVGPGATLRKLKETNIWVLCIKEKLSVVF